MNLQSLMVHVPGSIAKAIFTYNLIPVWSALTTKKFRCQICRENILGSRNQTQVIRHSSKQLDHYLYGRYCQTLFSKNITPEMTFL